MKTPKSFSDNVKNNIITEDILGACIYSVNKRAKNYRDNVHALYADLDSVKSHYGSTGVDYQYKNISAAKGHRDLYYEYKEQLLALVDPVSIHTEGSNTSSNLRYYLYYRVGGYSFHKPLEETDLDKYPDLPKEDIGSLTTFGHEIEDLISMQFVQKLLHLIHTNQYTFQRSN